MPNPWIWEPSREYIVNTNVFQFMQKLRISTYEEFLRYSTEHLEEFWDHMVRELSIEWFEPYRQVLDTSRGIEWARWFLGGKLNIAWNCLDRHAIAAGGSGKALIWEGENGDTREMTFGDLVRETNRLANALS